MKKSLGRLFDERMRPRSTAASSMMKIMLCVMFAILCVWCMETDVSAYCEDSCGGDSSDYVYLSNGASGHHVDCDYCGASWDEEHNWVAGSCTSAAWCRDCGYSLGKPAGHSYLYYTTEVETCTTDGRMVGYCTNAGCTSKDTIIIPATGHTEEEDDEDCTTPIYCEVCGEISTPGETSHAYGTPERKEPTCTKNGYVRKSCTRCGHIDFTDIFALGHNYSAATCTKPATCTRCSATTGSTLDHDFTGSYTFYWNDAHTASWVERKCTGCTAIRDAQTVVKQSNYHSAYCTEAEYWYHVAVTDEYGDQISQSCGVKHYGKAALGHNYSAATCTNPRTCTRCSETSGSALGHNYVNNVCTRCGIKSAHLAGKWRFKTTLSYWDANGDGSFNSADLKFVEINFTSDEIGMGGGYQYTGFRHRITGGLEFEFINSYGANVYYNKQYAWVKEAARNVDFGVDVQATSESFYEWITSNADRVLCTVTFDSNGGRWGTSESISGGLNPYLYRQRSAHVGARYSYYGGFPTSPSKTGYVFSGWYTAASGGTRVLLSSEVPASGCTLYAHWEPIEYTIGYDSNGGSGYTNDSEHIYDVAKNLTTNGFSKYGCKFMGWATTRDRANSYIVDYKNAAYVKNLTTVDGAILTMYAVWCDHPSQYVTASYSWNSNHTSCTATGTCSQCGYNWTESGTVSQNNYYGPNCCAEGKYDHIAIFDTLPSNVCPSWHSIEKLPHLWNTDEDDITYTWNSDHTSCTATTVCVRSCCVGKNVTYSESGTITQVNYTAPTCTTQGKYQHKATFASLGSTICPTWHYISELGHLWGDDVTYTWNSNHTSCTATVVCVRSCCSGKNVTYSESGRISQNSYIAPTCTEQGRYDHIATFDTLPSDVCPSWHYIDALGHLWSTDEDDITYTWNSDHTSCTATTVCVRSCCVGKNVTMTENGRISQNSYIAPTCTERGRYDHIATFDTLPSDVCPSWHYIDALGHLWSNITYTWNIGHTSCTAEKHCTRTGCTASMTEQGTITQVNYTAPTCTTQGKYQHKATFASLGSTICPSWHNIDALGHLWSNITYTWNSTHTGCTAQKYCTRTRCTASVTEQGAITRAHDTAPTPTAQSRYRHKATFDTLGSSTCPTWHYYDVEITNITFKYIGSSGAMETITDLDNIPYGITIYVYHTYRNNTELPVTVNGYHNSESSMVSYNNTTVFTIEAGKTKTVMAGSFTPGIGNGTYIGYVYMDGYAFGNTSAEDNSGNNSKSVNYRAVFDVELVEVYLADKNGNRLNTSKLMTNMKAYVHHVYRNNSAGPVSLDLYHDGVKCATISNVKGNSTQDVVVTEIILNNAGNVSYAGAIYRKGMTATTEQFETILANNTKSVSLAVIKSPELEASGTTADFTYRAGVEVIASFNLTNNSDVNYIPADPLTITMRIYDSKGILVHEMSQNAIVPAHKMQLVWFRWTAPDKDGTYKIVASVKYSDIEDELNVLEKNCKVQSRSAVSSTDTSYEGNMPDGWSNKDKKPTIKNETATWTVWEYKNNQFVEVRYGITVNAGSATILPSSTTAYQKYGTWYMKSGYGITIGASDATIGSLSGYTMPSADAYTGAQWAYATFPEFEYRVNEQTTMEQLNGEWIFNDNKLHYTPIWYPDSTTDANAYYVKLVQTDIWTPAGKLTVSGPSTGIWIEGDMYDDWYTS